jgi:hypothetical protein
MNKDFFVIHTPGAFGNFIAFLIDCHRAGKMLPAPFVESGASHDRHRDGATRSMDVVIPGVWSEVEKHPDKKMIGCVWQPEYFQYILHAYYSRTNGGQYGRCGVEYCQDDFYGFIYKHTASDRVRQDIDDLKKLFGITVDEHNRKVPRHVLRMFFWYKMIDEESNIVLQHNEKIKQYPGVDPIDITEIIDYVKLQSFFAKRFDKVLDFKDIHSSFLSKNRSLYEYNKALEIFNAIKNGTHIKIDDISVMGEAMILFHIEKHFFDIPFHAQIEFFSNTKQVIEYVQYFPQVLKQPNKLFHKHYKRFQAND